MPDLVADDVVTQYGRVFDRVPHFRCVPRQGEAGVSLIAGRLDVVDAIALVLPFRRGRVRAGDAVRYSRVGRLLAAGFAVEHRPSPYFEEHLEVEFAGVWDDGICQRFHRCFGRPLVVEVGHV